MIIDLDGPWLVREALGETWRWYVDSPLTPDAGNNVAAAAGVAAGTPGWLAARVPSSVRGDLLRAGEIPSPYVGRESKASEWVSERHWVYRCTVALPRPLADGELCVLELDGVDPLAHVLIDGVEVGSAAGPFEVTRLDVTVALADGAAHRLALVLAPAPDSQPQVGRTELVRVHAPRMTFGWDFCPRLVHQGIWRPVRLVVGAVVDDGLGVLAEVESGGGRAGARGVVRVRGPLRTSAGRRIWIEVGAAPAPETGASGDPVGGGVVEVTADEEGRADLDVELRVPDPTPWWPHGLGPQARYDVEVLADGEIVWSGRVGFRSIDWHATPGAPAGAEPYSLAVNGREVRLTGWNWAPADALYGEITPARLRHLLTVARDSGARLLRVWGGGLIETPEFYDLADELGLLVWQEFSMSSSGMQSAPATDSGFVEVMRAAARAAVAGIGHRPSLVLWGGGNELDVGGVPLATKDSPVLAAIADVLNALDPGRRWVATSPTGPVFHYRRDTIAERPDDLHDVHGPWEHQGLVEQYALFEAGTCLAHTEFGVEGMANARTLAALVPGDPRPLDRSNPVMRHLGEWWDNAPLVHAAFGGRLIEGPVGGAGPAGRVPPRSLVPSGAVEDLTAVRRASQLLQATGLRYAVEADLRRAPRCSMVLPWQLAESFPNAWCTAVVDHRGDAKPALHAVARAFAPERVTIRTARSVWDPGTRPTAEAWVWSEPGRAAGGSVSLRVLDVGGRPVSRDAGEPGENGLASVRLPTVGHPARSVALTVDPLPPGVYVWEACWRSVDETRVDIDRQFFAVGPDWSALVDLPPADLAVSVSVSVSAAGRGVAGSGGDVAGNGVEGGDASAFDQDRWGVRITNQSGHLVPLVHLLDGRPIGAPGWARVTGGAGPLLPGESREWTVTWDDAPGLTPMPGAGGGPGRAVARVLVLDAWNTPVRRVAGPAAHDPAPAPAPAAAPAPAPARTGPAPTDTLAAPAVPPIPPGAVP